MARTKNTEVVETKVEEEVKEIVPEIDYAKIIAEMQAKIESLQNTPAPVAPVIIQQDRGMADKKIRCINLMNNELNISTETNGNGRVFTFKGYGDTKLIGYNYLTEIVASYPITMEKGLVFISDKEAVESLGLTDEYSKIYTKEMIDKLIYLREETDIDLLFGMDETLRDSTIRRIAELMNANESFDYNTLRRIKKEINVDIEEVARNIKLSSGKVSVEEKEELL